MTKITQTLAADEPYSELFKTTSQELLTRERGRCWLTGKTAKEAGQPLTVIHFPVAREFAQSWNWASFAKDCQAGLWGAGAKSFDWVAFFVGAVDGKPLDPFKFVDDMRINGLVLAPGYSKSELMAYPKLLAQKYSVAPLAATRLASDVGHGDPPKPPG